MARQEDNWLVAFINRLAGPQKKTRIGDEDGAPASSLFKDINALRHQEPDADADAKEREKYTDGFLGKIATSKVFEFSTLGMICFNALAIGYDTNYSAVNNKPDNLLEGPIGFIIIENMFCGYFTIEVVIRFLAYKTKLNCFCDGWFVFDSCLVSMMIGETWILPFLGSGGPMAQLSIFRLLRLLRITRISRIMRAVPQMMVIIKGMLAATRTVCCTGALMVLVMYTFSILFTDAFHEHPWPDGEEPPGTEDMFGTLGKSMFSLFIMGAILDDVTACSNVIRESGNLWMLTAFVIFILISSFMMLNMLIGILVEVVAATADGEREKSIETNVREAIAKIFSNLDQDANKEISREEFMAMRHEPEVMSALADLDIMKTHFHLYAELFFSPQAVYEWTAAGIEQITAAGEHTNYGSPKEGEKVTGAAVKAFKGTVEEALKDATIKENCGVVPNLSYDKLVSMIFRLRPGSFVSALDFAAFSKAITGIHDRVKERVVTIDTLCQELARETGDDISDMMIAARPDANFTLPDPGAPPPVPKPPGTPADVVSSFVPLPASPLARRVLSDFDRERLEQTANAEIIEELQRRTGMADIDKTGVLPPHSMMDEELHLRKPTKDRNAEAFMTLGVPQDDNDSGTVYV